MNAIPYFLLLSLLASCSHRNENPDIIIEGRVTGIPDGKLYLVKAEKWKSPVDSAVCKNGRFIFQIKTATSFVPYLAAIHYWNNGDTIHPVRLQFRNHTMNDSLGLSMDVFYLEKEKTMITRPQSNKPYLRISAGKETELLYKYQLMDIGWMGNADTLLRRHKLLYLQSSIQEHPGSFFLLQSIYDSKELYSLEEIRSLLLLFDATVMQSTHGIKFLDYLQVRTATGSAYPNLQLLTAADTRQPIIDTTAPLNMLVFWASWCAPCINEIPQLKIIHRLFAGKGLRIKSISIDTNKEAWLLAMQRHKMDWPQLIIAKEKIEETEHIFNFGAIPFLVFTDNKGIELARFADYDEGNIKKYKELINRYLK
jgi:thiol-disulfide isomerase/thioredoxin